MSRDDVAFAHLVRGPLRQLRDRRNLSQRLGGPDANLLGIAVKQRKTCTAGQRQIYRVGCATVAGRFGASRSGFARAETVRHDVGRQDACAQDPRDLCMGLDAGVDSTRRTPKLPGAGAGRPRRLPRSLAACVAGDGRGRRRLGTRSGPRRVGRRSTRTFAPDDSGDFPWGFSLGIFRGDPFRGDLSASGAPWSGRRPTAAGGAGGRHRAAAS